jgi:hypothetical protein
MFIKGRMIEKIRPTTAKMPRRLVRWRTTAARLSVDSRILRCTDVRRADIPLKRGRLFT